MRWILIAIVAVIGVLAIVLPMPLVLNWAPKMAHTAQGHGHRLAWCPPSA